MKSLNHKGHEGTPMKTHKNEGSPSCTFVPFVVIGFKHAD
jgi:hypothetical protein